MESKACLSIKSKKHPDQRCESKVIDGDFCPRHSKSKILWSESTSSRAPEPVKTKNLMTRKQRVATEKIYRFWVSYGRRKIRKIHGPSTFISEISQNDTDITTLEPISTIPLRYRFSYSDMNKHIWTFDLRFLVQMIHYGNEMKNPYTQDVFEKPVVERLQALTQTLIHNKLPVLYTNEATLTPEQVWNQKVLDVFLKLNSLGYAVNLIWFEEMTVSQHHSFYTILYNMWTTDFSLRIQEKENLVAGYNSGRNPLFRWTPDVIVGKMNTLKWWRKNNLGLMNAFVTRAKDRTFQNCSALYVLTALVESVPAARESFPWL
jgi:hypothetical protein